MYVDFLDVDEVPRARELGTRMLGALASQLHGRRVWLTCDENDLEALYPCEHPGCGCLSDARAHHLTLSGRV